MSAMVRRVRHEGKRKGTHDLGKLSIPGYGQLMEEELAGCRRPIELR
jgi:hypothetical protein